MLNKLAEIIGILKSKKDHETSPDNVNERVNRLLAMVNGEDKWFIEVKRRDNSELEKCIEECENECDNGKAMSGG